MKTIILFLFLFAGMGIVQAEDGANPVLRFDKNGKFKILQITDVHFQYDSYRSDSALVMIERAIAAETPDLIVLTGDVVCSKNTKLAWFALTQVLIDAQVPWAVTLGNHDIEYELTGKEIMETIADLPYNLTLDGPVDVEGHGNYVLEVKSQKIPDTAALLYFLDSHSGLHPDEEMGSYAWITNSQIEWYRNQSQKFTKANGNKPMPALAFFHIPLPEYKEVLNKETTVGIQEESICSPDLNSGLYTAMVQAQDVMGMFVGHDHNNNYIGCLRKICMAYGVTSGRQCYGKIGRGYRVIELYENERKFDTWVQTKYECDRDNDIWLPSKEDQRKYFVTYPDSFWDAN